MPNVVLRTEGLTKRYGALTAVNNLTLDVFEGEVFGFLGPNGAGKTTAISMMCGLLKPDAGQVFVHGQPIASGGADVTTRVGVCPQEIVVWPRLTCIEQLQFIGEMYGIAGSEARKRGALLLDELDLAEKRNQQAHTLVLDEPEAGLDPQSRVKVRDFVRTLARKKTIILTTHNMDEADRVADRVAIIDHGELMVLDTPNALKHSFGKGDVLEIGLKEGSPDGETAKRALAPLGMQLTLDMMQGSLIIRARDAVNLMPAIVAALAAAGVRCGEVRLRETTLEDVFIQLTGRRLRE